jgi:Ras GTPase-activating-like protein IQGAP2/3
MPHLNNDDLDKLEKSSTPQLRHLSQIAAESGSTDELEVHSPQEQVTGLAGRRRLQRSGSTRVVKAQSKFASAYTNTKWMDTQRKHLQAYEYLCHIGEARAWLEDVLEPDKLPPIVELEQALRDGVTLAEAVVRLAPSLSAAQQRALGSQRIFRSPRLQFRHSDNIALFFRFLAEIELPELFRFELVDLYEKKNIPKVIYCIHALSWMLFRKGIVEFHIGNLVGQLQFEDHELEETQKGIDRSGVAMPNFGGMREAMQIEEEPLPPEPTPEELLAEQEEVINDLQAQVRGALVRMRLGSVMQGLWDAEAHIAHFQSLARGGFARQVFDFRHAMDASTKRFQAASKAFLIRRSLTQKQSTWENNKVAVVRLQSLWRGRQQRVNTQTIRTQLSCHKHGLKEFQAAIRGALGRWRASDVWQETRDTQNEALIQALQAAARGAVERMRIGRTMNSLWDVEDAVVELQAIIRATHVRSENRGHKTATRQETAQVVELQAAARGLLQRFRNKQQHGKWQMHESGVIQAQAAARGLLERLRQARTQGALQGRETTIVKLQTIIRARNARAQHGHVVEELQSHHNPLERLQALARGQAERQKTEFIRSSLKMHEQGVLNIQALARAMIERRRIGTDLSVLEDVEDKITDLQSLARAYLERQRVFEQLVEMEREDDQIVQLQALSRAILVRSSIGSILAELESYEADIVDVQAALRGFVIRRRFAEKRRHYNENMQKVIKLQSIVRAKQQGESYKSLVTGKNPPLPVVRRHLHLLTDSNLEFEGELEAERLRQQVVESVRRNELVEKYVEGLDVKIALLLKNKIALDEVVKHQKHFGGSAAQLLRSGSTLSHGNGLDLKALNKNSRKKLTGYEELFFLVQTQSQYLTRLFAQISSRGLAEKDSKNLERLMLALFGQAQKSREEQLLVKVLAQSNQVTISQCQNLEDLTRQHNGTFHQRLLLNYVRSPRDRAYLKTLLGSMIRDGICAQDNLDLESDPLQIYRAILNNEELSTGRPSQRPRDLPREVVIRQEDVRPRYVEHLEELRDLGDAFFANLEESLHRMPYGIRYLAAEQHRALCNQFSHDDPAHLALYVGTWLWKSYILPAVREPEMWGVVDRGLSPVHKRNLAQVITLLGQVAGTGRLFGAENIYLQPLNSWVGESLERWQTCLQNCFDIPSPEQHYDADQYSDLYSTTKPTLYIKLADVFAIHGVIVDNLNVMSSMRDDPIKEILMDLGTPKSNESDLGGAGNGGEITLTLKSRFTIQEDPNAETRAMFMATKRLILYIIRVQTGSNLMEILLRPITHEDADRWIALVQEEIDEKEREQRSSRRPRSAVFDPRHSFRGSRPKSVYSEAPSAFSSDDRRGNELQDLHGMTYAELKSSALENILQLEQSHVAPQYRVSRQNHYQELLNALASDIRQKHRRRLDRQRETEATRATLSQLDAKAIYLEDQLKNYNDYIEQCLHTLASKKQNKHSSSTFGVRSAGGKFILPFTKQWSHERELERAGRKPQFGSYKYSLRQLADKGVLLGWPRFTPDQWSQVDVVVSSDEVGVFHLEASTGSLMVPGASANVLLDELLQAQYDNRNAVVVFEEGGSGGVSVGAGGTTTASGASLAVNLLLHLVFKKFYRDE